MKFKEIFKFIKKEVVLVIAISLAIISAIIVQQMLYGYMNLSFLNNKLYFKKK